jgi:hypothetical protein
MLLGDGLMSTDWTIRFAHDIEGMNKNPRNGRNPRLKAIFAAVGSSSGTYRSSVRKIRTFKLLYAWPQAGRSSLRRG